MTTWTIPQGCGFIERKGNGTLVAQIYFETFREFVEFHWEKIPQKGTLRHNDVPVDRIIVEWPRGKFYPRDLGDLRKMGMEKVLDIQHPNTARMKHIMEAREFHDNRRSELLAPGNDNIVRLDLKWNGTKGSWQCFVEDDEDWYNAVYVVDGKVQSVHDREEGRYFCKVTKRNAVDHPPNGTRTGFKLHVVQVLLEDYETDEETKRLNALILAGKP